MHAMPSIMYHSSECLHESVLVKFMHSEYHYSAHNALLLAVQLPHVVYNMANQPYAQFERFPLDKCNKHNFGVKV